MQYLNLMCEADYKNILHRFHFVCKLFVTIIVSNLVTSLVTQVARGYMISF